MYYAINNCSVTRKMKANYTQLEHIFYRKHNSISIGKTTVNMRLVHTKPYECLLPQLLACRELLQVLGYTAVHLHTTFHD